MNIGHYASGISLPGGVASYIRRVSEAQERDGHQIFYFDLVSFSNSNTEGLRSVCYINDQKELMAHAAKQKLDILHLHMDIPGDGEWNLPVVRTVHGHQAYCPSGSRFLKASSQPCPRTYSFPLCLWGHFVDRCGSIRPKSIISNYRHTLQEMTALRKIPAITVSQFIKLQMVRAGYLEERIKVLYLFAPKQQTYTPPPTDSIPRFLFLGRLTRTKGLDWLLQATARVQCPIHIDIAGEGEDEQRCRDLCRRLQIEDRVTFHGWVNGESVRRLLLNARALVFPSIWHEPGGTVAFEAMANGRAVIVSQVGGMPEVILDGQNGITVPPGDMDALAQAMERLARDWTLSRDLGVEGRKHTQERYTIDDHLTSLYGIYEEILMRNVGTGSVLC